MNLWHLRSNRKDELRYELQIKVFQSRRHWNAKRNHFRASRGSTNTAKKKKGKDADTKSPLGLCGHACVWSHRRQAHPLPGFLWSAGRRWVHGHGRQRRDGDGHSTLPAGRASPLTVCKQGKNHQTDFFVVFLWLLIFFFFFFCKAIT